MYGVGSTASVPISRGKASYTVGPLGNGPTIEALWKNSQMFNLIHPHLQASLLIISILEFSRRLDGLFTAIQIAPFRAFDPTISSQSDLWYVPTLQTFILYK